MSTVPYTFQLKKFNQFGADYEYAVIRTDLDKVKPEIINTQIKKTPHIGINGGFFAADNGYDKPPTGLRAISWWKGDSTSYKYNGTPSNQVSRKTFIAYKDSNNLVRGAYMYAKNLDEILANYPTATAAIGGNDYNLDSWGSVWFLEKGTVATWRAAFAWDNSSRYGYMIVTQNKTVNVLTLKNHLELMGYDPVNSIILDGSQSTTMRVAVNGAVQYYGGNHPHTRHIGNMLRVYGYDFYG